MRKVLLRGVLVLLVAVLAWATIAWTDALPRLDAADHAAIRFIEQAAPAPDGSDALVLLYRMSRNVPAADAEALEALPHAALLQRMRDYPARRVATVLERDDLPTLAAADAATLRESVSAHGEALGLRAALHAADYLSWPGPAPAAGDLLAVPEPLPALQDAARLLRQHAALRSLDGDAAGAAEELCASTASWRRLLASSTALLPTMQLARQADLDARLLAELRARAPAAAAVDCPVLEVAPEPARLCPAMRTEYRALAAYTHALANASSAWERATFDLVFHHEHARALRARVFGHWCEDAPAPLAAASVECGPLERAFDMVGCTLAPIAMPAYAGYGARLRDHDAALRLAALADWLRREAGADPAAMAARFAARPAALTVDGVRLRSDTSGVWLEFDAKAPQVLPRGAPIPVLLPQEL
jgi:hypothetical protein